LRARLAAAEAAAEAAAPAKDAEIARLKEELRVCREALATAEARIRELEEENRRLREENARLSHDNTELELLLRRCAEEKRQAQEELSRLLRAEPVGGGGGVPWQAPPSPAASESPPPGEEEADIQLPKQNALTNEQRNEVFFFLNRVFINWVFQSGSSILSRYTGVDKADKSIIDGIPVGNLLKSFKIILNDLTSNMRAREKYSLSILTAKKERGDHIRDFKEFMKDAYDVWSGGKNIGFNANRFRRLILILFKLAYMYINENFCTDDVDKSCSEEYIIDIYDTMDGDKLLQRVFNPRNVEPTKTKKRINNLFLNTYLKNTFAIDKDDNVFFMDKYNSHPHTPLNDPKYFYNIKWENPNSLRFFIQYWNEKLGKGAGAGGAARRPQIGGGRKTSVKSLSQGMLLLFLVELRKSNQLKSAKEVQTLVNKAGKALDSIGQYELVLTILQEIIGNIDTHSEEGYTYVSLGSMKKEKADALIESYNQVFDKRDAQMFKTLGTAGSFHASAPEEFEEVLGKGPFCLVLGEDKEGGEGEEETPLHGVSDEYEVVLEEKERNVLEDNGGIPLGGVIFLYLVCLNELYCDSSDEECIRPTR
jgi:TolA-binding protein